MIALAWSVLAEKVIVDQETNNVSLDVLEQLDLGVVPPVPSGRRGFAVPIGVEIVSLWYRPDAQGPVRARQRIRLSDPNGDELTSAETEIDLSTYTRLRARQILPVLPIRGPGMYYFHIDLERQNAWTEMAKVPLEIRFSFASQGALEQTAPP
jgi:hypothetical protein